eukprot:s66_g24.t1
MESDPEVRVCTDTREDMFADMETETANTGTIATATINLHLYLWLWLFLWLYLDLDLYLSASPGFRATAKAAKGRQEAPSPPARPVLEDDLTLDDYGSDDEAVASQFTPLPPNSAVSRRRMEARAQQCVVCFMEKAHTLVPPHANPAPQTSSHRFCQRRGPIDVPDAWYVALDLPDHWCRRLPVLPPGSRVIGLV